jgi:hypothetical protein
MLERFQVEVRRPRATVTTSNFRSLRDWNDELQDALVASCLCRFRSRFGRTTCTKLGEAVNGSDP